MRRNSCGQGQGFRADGFGRTGLWVDEFEFGADVLVGLGRAGFEGHVRRSGGMSFYPCCSHNVKVDNSLFPVPQWFV